MIYVHPQAEPFILKGETDTALLFIHGFTASPSEVYPVARLVHASNSCTVTGILLPGHGSHPKFLNRCKWWDWYGAVEMELNYLMENYERVFVAGLSMGGLLAMQAGLNIKGLKGLVTINAPIYYQNPLLPCCAPLYGYIRPYYPKKIDTELLRLEEEGRFAYRVMPVKAFRNLMRLRVSIMSNIQQMKIPVLIMQSLLDESVAAKSGDFILEKTQGADARLVKLRHSGHVATMGVEKEQITQEIVAFMSQQ